MSKKPPIKNKTSKAELAASYEAKLSAQRELLRERNSEIKALRKQLRGHEASEAAVEHLAERSVTAQRIQRKKGRGHQATAVFGFSDWHAGEFVDKAQVNGRNEYNLAIFRNRAKNAFAHGLELVNLHRNGVKIDSLICGLIGDMMTGTIHHDLAITNTAQPPEEIYELRSVLKSGLDYLLEEGSFTKILVPCCYGNHGRGTQRKSYAAGAKTSWEVLLYRLLKDDFEGENRIEFVVAEGPQVYTPVYDQVIRWTHGDDFRFAGGIGGVLIPARKAVDMKWESLQHADQTIMGHWHQLCWDRNMVINGSLIGWSAYSFSHGVYERPQQIFMLMDEKHGRTALHPILVDTK